MRQPDYNRVKRAMEHIMAAITCINSIKWEHRTDNDDRFLEATKKNLADEWRDMNIFATARKMEAENEEEDR